ncbi:hypothetical protein PspLS_09525 [Pyricularia sp. CBS 133598]|nr:hypothetical protein PspLS_09525 [Pyricularia sp. CBS 133598]
MESLSSEMKANIKDVPEEELDRIRQVLSGDVWKLERDGVHNRHLYSNEAHYLGMKFTYPIDLPDQLIEPLPDEDGTLELVTYAVPVVA